MNCSGSDPKHNGTGQFSGDLPLDCREENAPWFSVVALQSIHHPILTVRYDKGSLITPVLSNRLEFDFYCILLEGF
jgi:hypothetical protein